MQLCLGMAASAANAHKQSSLQQAFSSILSFSGLHQTSDKKKVGVENESERSCSSSSIEGMPSEAIGDQYHDSFSESGISVANSSGSRRKGKSEKPKTSFFLAHPPPSIAPKQKLHLRPRLILQLQRANISGRAEPAFDVLPSTHTPALSRKFPRFFKGKAGLGVDDLIIMTSPTYQSPHKGKEKVPNDYSVWESRQVVGTIFQPQVAPAGADFSAEICLVDGSVWEAQSLPGEVYELKSRAYGGVETVARWVPRRRPRSGRPRYSHGPSTSISASNWEAFSFSLLDPTSRKHPIIARMDHKSIVVSDLYSKLDSMRSPLRSPSAQHSADVSTEAPAASRKVASPESAQALGKSDYLVDEDLRLLIVASGVWVSLCAGWSDDFKYHPRSRRADSSTPKTGFSESTSRRPDATRDRSYGDSVSAETASLSGLASHTDSLQLTDSSRRNSVRAPSIASRAPSSSGVLVEQSHQLSPSITPALEALALDDQQSAQSVHASADSPHSRRKRYSTASTNDKAIKTMISNARDKSQLTNDDAAENGGLENRTSSSSSTYKKRWSRISSLGRR